MTDVYVAPPEGALRDLLADTKSTAGARFNASKRLAGKDRALTRLTAFTSAYIIIFTALPYIAKLSPLASDHLNLINLSLAIVVLVSSLLQYSSNDVVNSEQHHRCALEINEMRRNLKASPSPVSSGRVLEEVERYNNILQKYSVNHDDVDYLKHKLTHRRDYPTVTEWQLRSGEARVFIDEHFLTALLWISTAMCLIISGYYVVPFSRLQGDRPAAAAAIRGQTQSSPPQVGGAPSRTPSERRHHGR